MNNFCLFPRFLDPSWLHLFGDVSVFRLRNSYDRFAFLFDVFDVPVPEPSSVNESLRTLIMMVIVVTSNVFEL